MAETQDPVAALGAPQISVRCAGARDLAQEGGPEHLERLIDLAIRDPSSGVRLGCAAAAADILSRFRAPDRRGTIPDATRQELLGRLVRAEPGVNPGLFQVAAGLDLPEATSRILLALRDPRADVRVGAVVGLYRLAVSATRAGDRELEAAAVAALVDPKVRPETRAEVARVAANLGWASALPATRELAASTAKGVAAVAGEALQRLEAAPPADGLWIDLGLDAGEVRPGATVTAWVATVGDAVLRVTPRGVTTSSRASGRRHVRWKREGEPEASVALQERGVTLYAADGDQQARLGELLVAQGAWEAADRIDPILPATAATLRLRGAAALARGDVATALTALEAAVAGKKVPPDAWWHLARALKAAGREPEARPHLERFLAKAAKKAPFVADAREWLDSAG